MYYEIKDPEGKILISNTPSQYKQLSHCPLGSHYDPAFNGQPIRYARSMNQDGTVFLVATEGTVLTSAREFNEHLRIHKAFIAEVREMRADLLNEMSHDITDLAGRSAQEVITLLNQSTLSQKQTYQEQLAYAEPVVRRDSEQAAEILLRIHKNSVLMNSIIVGLEAKYYRSPLLSFDNDSIRTVIANILLIFRKDFERLGVDIHFENSGVIAFFDYRTFGAAICPILENATKYICRDSEIHIRIRSVQGTAQVAFEMTSLRILPNEQALIFSEGFSGSQAKLIGAQGKGLGLYISRRLLELNNATITLEIVENSQQLIEGIEYQKNIFLISF